MFEVIWTTVKLATVTTVLLILLSTPVAWGLSQRRTWWKDVVGTILSLPIVLPPTVLGFYLLLTLAPQSPVMALLHPFGIRSLAFTFTGLVIGSMIYSLPFAVSPLRDAFIAMGDGPMEVAVTLRASPLDAFLNVAIPQAGRGFATAAILVFAHTVGEFGVILMIGGAIPGQTEVVSIRIYQLVESMRFNEAHRLAAGLLAFAFCVLLVISRLDRGGKV
ncbi:MAG: molybdate ABC transporter permease subunit [Phenylobacterium zucineum]|nr:MAG: molybdate ABC transporter permease subunit [Phenylobacterium zucineum]